MSICIKENNVGYQSLKQLRFSSLLSHLDLNKIATQVVTAVQLNKTSIASDLRLSATTLESACKTLAEDFSVEPEALRQAAINGLFCSLEGTYSPSRHSTQSQISDLERFRLVSFAKKSSLVTRTTLSSQFLLF